MRPQAQINLLFERPHGVLRLTNRLQQFPTRTVMQLAMMVVERNASGQVFNHGAISVAMGGLGDAADAVLPVSGFVQPGNPNVAPSPRTARLKVAAARTRIGRRLHKTPMPALSDTTRLRVLATAANIAFARGRAPTGTLAMA